MLKKTLFLTLAVLVPALLQAVPKGPAVPARIDVEVAPGGVSAGGTIDVTLRLTAVDGVQINRYPAVSLDIPETAGLTPGGKTRVGNRTPPPLDEMDRNYFDDVDPLRIELPVLPAARDGKHEVAGRVTYTYCVKASGFCARKRVPVSIPISVR